MPTSTDEDIGKRTNERFWRRNDVKSTHGIFWMLGSQAKSIAAGGGGAGVGGGDGEANSKFENIWSLLGFGDAQR